MLAVSGDGEPADWWRVVASSAWDELDRTGREVDTRDLEPPVPDDAGSGG